MGRCNIQASLNFQAPSTLHGHQVSPSSCHSPSRSSSPPPQLSPQGHHQAFTDPPHIPESRVPRSTPFFEITKHTPTFCKRSVSRCVSFQAGGLPGTVLASTVSAQQLPSTVSRICRTSRRLSNCGIPTTLTTRTTLTTSTKTTNQHQDKSDKCNYWQALLYLWNLTIDMDNPCQHQNQY